MLRRRWPIIAFLAWTAYVWTTRLINAWSATDETSTAKATSTVYAVGLLVAAAIGAVVLLAARGRSLSAGETTFFAWFGWATCAIWAGRMIQILLFDAQHDVPFKVVHTVLGVISVVLAAATIVVARSERGADAQDSPVEDSLVEDVPVEGSLIDNVDR